MTLQILDCEQRSPDWWQARLGIPTASEFSKILAKGEGKTRASYMRRLAGEILTGEPAETFESAAMIRGREMEAEARESYRFVYGADPQPVGFIRNGAKGCSPDSLIGDDGMLEIKTQKAELLVKTILDDRFPPEHKAQVQGQLWVAERQWCDLCVFWPGLPLFVKRAERDEEYIKALAEAVERFNEELAEMVEQVQRYGEAA